MKKIEYRVVRFETGLRERVSGEDFGERFLQVLTAEGNEGWDLKQVIRESGMESLLIFSREAAGS